MSEKKTRPIQMRIQDDPFGLVFESQQGERAISLLDGETGLALVFEIMQAPAVKEAAEKFKIRLVVPDHCNWKFRLWARKLVNLFKIWSD